MAEHSDAGVTGSVIDDELADSAIDDERIDDPILDSDEPTPRLGRLSTTGVAVVAGAIVVAALGSVTAWLGWNVEQDREAQVQRTTMINVARQGAVNLTTIDFNEVDADIARILDSSMGTFHDDFQQRAQPFVDVVKQAKSKSVGTVTEAGFESQDGDRGRVLVAVSVKTSNVGGQDQPPRAWRMRIDVQKDNETYKVSDVQFVP